MKILVVEDERDLLERICQALRKEGYSLDAAGNGQVGLYYALNFDYDAIILDVMLPYLDGWALLEQLRRTKLTPVLMLTAPDQIRDQLHGLSVGVDDYVVKPFDCAELCARLRAIMSRHASQGRNVIEIGDVKVDASLHLITKSGQKLEFTPREYRLIEFLALHRGHVISRAQICQHLASGGEDAASNVLDVHVFNIRKKLGANFITTRRGHGYCIE